MDRRTVWAILLMMVIAVAPALFLKKPASLAGGRPDSLSVRRPTPLPRLPARSPTLAATDTARRGGDRPWRVVRRRAAAEERSASPPRSTPRRQHRGARLVQAELHRYASRAPHRAGRARFSTRKATCSTSPWCGGGHDRFQ